MDKKLFTEAMKQIWYYILAYFTNYLMPILKETFEKTKTYFINLLWDSVKEEFTCRVKSTVEFIETFFESPDYKEKEKAVTRQPFLFLLGGNQVNFTLFHNPTNPHRPIRIFHRTKKR